MKKLIFTFFATVALVCSCNEFDASEINERIDDFELRISRLETKVNENAQAISRIANAVTVTSVTNVENGFRIVFSNGETYTITNGANGTNGTNGHNGQNGQDAVAPTVGVTTVDGVLYWTINNELALDDKGNKVPCQTEPRLTPEFKTEGDQWYCTFDGEHWTKVSAGVSISVITFEETSDSIIFTIDGNKFVLAKVAVFSLKISNDVLMLNPNESAPVNYTLTGDDGTVHFIIEDYLYTAVLDTAAKTVTFTAPAPEVDATNGYVIIQAVRNSDGAVSAQYVGFEKGEISVVGDYFDVPAEGGTYQVNVTTNLTYTVEFDCEWLSLLPSLSAVHLDVLNVQAAASSIFDQRTGTLTITSTMGDKFVTVFRQAAYDDGVTMGVKVRPYILATAEDVLSMPSKLIKNNPTEVYFELSADIDLAGASFESTAGHACLDGSGEYPINFDGKGHKISNFTATGGVAPSFFGFLWGHVKNVTFDNANITSIGEKAAVVAATVGLTGWGRDHAGYLENVHVTNSQVTHTTDGNLVWTGQSGIVAGELMYEGSYIKNCSASGSSVTGVYCVGGIVAQLDNGTLVDGCCVKSCTIEGTALNPGYDASLNVNWNDKGWVNPAAYNDFNVACGYIGGIAGMANKSTLQNCYSDLSSSASMGDQGRYGGGVLGVILAQSVLKNCWAGAYVSVGTNAGGILGGSGWYVGGGSVISDCIAWNKAGSGETGVYGGNDSGNSIGATANPHHDNGYGSTYVYRMYTYASLILHAGGWGTAVHSNNKCPDGAVAKANIHGFNTNDIIATAHALNWDETIWDLTGDLPALKWEKAE